MVYCAQLAGLLSLARNADAAMPKVQFKDLGRKTILYENIEFSHSSIATVVRGVMNEYNEDCEKLLTGVGKEEFGFPFDISSLRDQPSNLEPGFSFLRDRRNAIASERHTLLRYLIDGQIPGKSLDKAPPSLGKMYVVQGQRTHLMQPAAAEFLSRAANMEKHLVTMLHLSMGQPARGEELANLTICNVVASELRSLHIMHGTLCFVTGYHKTSNQVGFQSCCTITAVLTSFC